jgi:small conductance mechanosensitive channel
MKLRLRFYCGLVAFLCLLLLPLAGRPAAAESPATATPAVSAAELQQLVDTLKDPTARDKLVAELQALIAAERGAQPQAAAPTTAGVIDDLSRAIADITDEILATASVLLDAPLLIGWAKAQIGDPAMREQWLAIALKLAIIFGAALAADAAARWALRRPAARFAARPHDRAGVRLLLMIPGTILEALPVIVFAGVAFFVMPFARLHLGEEQAAIVLVWAVFWARLILAAARVALLSPSAAGLVNFSEETRNYLYIWARRFTGWAIFGPAVANGAWWLGVPGAVYVLVLRGTVMVLAILAVIFILQNRRAVAEWLRGNASAAKVSKRGEERRWGLLRNQMAEIWHILAIIYVVGTFGIYVLHIEGGLALLLRATLLSVVVLLAAALVLRFINRLGRTGFAVRPDLKARFPTLEARTNRYLPVLFFLASAIVYLFTALALLQVWGVGAFAWFDTVAGRQVRGSLFATLVVLVLALVLWELFSAAIERYLHSLAAGPHAQHARIRTLLPLLRTTVAVLIIVTTGLIVLAQLGVNIAPFLAGAGVIGLAVGFGSQALVKDVITGLFILAEDQLAVGDAVDVGKGQGVVEAISIRSLRLRDIAGNLVNIPFSEVTTVKNMSRDYAYVVCDIGVVFREDPDRVTTVLRRVGTELAADPAWSRYLLGPVQVLGLDRFTDNAVVIRSQVKVAPLQQWNVGRELNRRIKRAFDADGIEMPAGNQTRYLDTPPEKERAEPPLAARPQG